MKNGFAQIIIPEFIFTDGSVGIFSGFDRGSYPFDGDVPPKWLWEMGVFDTQGNYFKIEVDTRKAKKTKTVTFILGGVAYYHSIHSFATILCKVNPKNGHLLPHDSCEECHEDTQPISLN